MITMRPTIRNIILYLSLGILISIVGCKGGLRTEIVEDTVTRAFLTPPGVRVLVESFAGPVNVVAGTESTTLVVVTRRGTGSSGTKAHEDLENIKVSLELEEDTLFVVVSYIGEVPPPQSAALINLTIPSDARLDISTSGSHLTTDGVTRQQILNNSSGDITIKNGGGVIEANSNNGDIDIQAQDASIQAKTSNGGIRYTGSTVNGEHTFVTSNADVTLKLPYDASFYLDAKTSSGDINCGYELSNSEEIQPHQIRGTVGAEPATLLVISTSNGNISIQPDLQASSKWGGKPGGRYPLAVTESVKQLAGKLELSVEGIQVVDFSRVDWPNGCLGILGDAEGCSQEVVRGYKVILKALEEYFIFHTDNQGIKVILADGPVHLIDDPIMFWSNNQADKCQTVLINEEIALFGPCESSFMQGGYLSEKRKEELKYFLKKFAPVKGNTPAGRITFSGWGTISATSDEQRMLAEWARLAGQESVVGQVWETQGIAYIWRRSDAEDNPCDEVIVRLTGEALISSCRLGAPEPGRVNLISEQLALVYKWVDNLTGFEVTETETLQDQTLSVDLLFLGQGSGDAGQRDIGAMIDLAGAIFAQWFTEANEK